MRGEPLYGVTPNSEHLQRDSISCKQFCTGTAQAEMERYIKHHAGFCNDWIRLYNELNFRLFRYSTAEKLVLGKQDFFYEEMYITEYLGRNFIGDRYIQKKVLLLKQLQQLLKEKYGVTLFLVFEPGKTYFSPEQIPDRYHPEIKGVSNYERFLYFCGKAQVDYLDLNHYFRTLKRDSPHLLYSKYGVHWSTYGLWVATDTLTHFIENKEYINLPDYKRVGDSTSTVNKDLDFDLEPSMNLLCGLPHEKMYFPIYRFTYEPQIHSKPRVLTIADSYYWSFWNSGISENLFSDNQYWYYNRTVYPDIWGDDAHFVDKSKLKEVIENQDIILLMITDANLYDFGWNFIEESLKALNPTYKDDEELAVLNTILSDKNWYAALLSESVRKQKPFKDILYQTVAYEMKQKSE